jgi:hypothetical protein
MIKPDMRDRKEFKRWCYMVLGNQRRHPISPRRTIWHSDVYVPTERDPNTAIFLLFTEAAAAFVADILKYPRPCAISGVCA